MKNALIKTMSLVLVLLLCTMLFGCDVVLKDETVLLSSADATTTTTAASSGASGDTTGTAGGSTAGTTGTTKAQQSSTKNVEKKLSGTLEIQCWTNENKTQTAVYTQLFDMFEKETGVKVTAHVGSQVNQAMTKRWINGNPPDIAFLAGSGIPDIALEASGALYDCTDIIKNGYVYGTDTKIMDAIDTNLIEWTDNGRIMRPPSSAGDGSFYGYWYDTVFMNQLGLTAPTTYNELMSFADKVIAKGEAVYTCFGMSGSYNGWSMVWPAIAQELGQTQFDEFIKGTKAAWSSAGVKKIYNRWNDFCRKEGVLAVGTTSWDHTTSQMKWLNHTAVLIANGEWLPWEMETSTPSTFKMEFVGCPMGDDNDKPSVVLQGGRMIVPSKCKNLENALAFLRYLYRDDRPQIRDNAGANAKAALDQCYAYIESGKCDVYYKKYDWGELNTEAGNSVHSILTGDATVDEAIKNVLNKTTK